MKYQLRMCRYPEECPREWENVGPAYDKPEGVGYEYTDYSQSYRAGKIWKVVELETGAEKDVWQFMHEHA